VPGQLLWDIGAGSGSISIEWCARHGSLRAVMIEANPERAERAAANALRLGAIGAVPRLGRAPEALAGLETPDAVFIGGGAHHEGVVETAMQALRPGGRLVVNAVAAATEGLLISLATTHGGELLRFGVERLERLGSLSGFRPARTLTQWSWMKPA
jgi:precorrin-6Y C5,15-methyltransferase (decarboxylating)